VLQLKLTSLTKIIMDQPVRMTPKDFFINLAGAVALYVSIISLLNLLFEIINRLFPDALTQGYYYSGYYSSGIRLAIACLFIFFPIFVLISWFQNKQDKEMPEKKNLGFRKWLTYLTLFLAGLAIVIDLVVLINTFLGGEITARFVWKVLAVLVVVGATFAYHIYDLKKNMADTSKLKVFAYFACLLVLTSIALGFFVIGSPFTERLRLFDERRANDLQNIQGQIINFWQAKGKLPKDLSELYDPISGYALPVDPKTSLPYEYSSSAQMFFQLCAVFELSNEQANNQNPKAKIARPVSVTYGNAPILDMYGNVDTWNHGSGRTCFDRTIDPERYPIMKNVKSVTI